MSVRLGTIPKETAYAKFGTGLSILCWPRSSVQVRDWSEWVSYITFCYNATVHSATGFAPFFVFTGRQPLWTVDLFVPEAEGPGKTVPVYTAETVDRLNRAMHLVREHLQASARREVLVVGTTAEPGPGSLPRGTLFVYIVPANSLAVHQNGCRSMPLKARSSVS